MMACRRVPVQLSHCTAQDLRKPSQALFGEVVTAPDG
jgi:hypothetical protein